MFGARSGSDLGSLSAASGRTMRCRASSAARAGSRSPAVRLSAPAYPAGARGHRHEPQEAAPALSRGAAAGAPARRPQAGAGDQGADGAATGRQPALEPRLPVAMRSPTAGASASSRSSTTSPASAWRWSPTPRCRACGSRASSMPSSLARGRPAMIVSDNGTELTSMAILRWSQEHADRMALHRARQAAAECLRRELQRPAARRAVERDAVHLARPRPRGAGRSGRMTTTRFGRTADSATCRLPNTPNSPRPECNGTGRCAMSGAPRPVPLHHRAIRLK